MLVELVVENYAVIERVRVRFHDGLNLLTGETGSGKSMVVDALGLLFGGRASPEMIRTGEERARISGIFELPDDARLRTLLEQSGIEFEDHELIVEREILAGGKSRAFAGSRPVTATLLRDLAPLLGDIHGQHDQQRLFDAGAQLEMLDAFARHQQLLAEVAELYRRWRACTSELEALDRREQENLRLADLWSFQRREIDAAHLKPGEDAALESERRVLQNVARLQELATAAYESLYDSESSAEARLRQATRRLEELSRIDPALNESRAALQPAEIAIQEASFAVREYLGRLEADPGRLEEIEARLALIDKLKRKYGAAIDRILVFLDDVQAKLSAVENAGELRAALEKERALLAASYLEVARRLSAGRSDAARKLEKQVESELALLAMERTTFRVRIETDTWSDSGTDRVEFLVSPNVGEEPRPLDKVASGGEISRIALALKTCVGAAGRARPKGAPRTLVFDEVDSGIGGAAAETVGRRLKQLAGSNQVLCVTHLPQVAAFADHHYAVEKREIKGRAAVEIEELSGDARTREIGRMLSGQQVTPEALKHAERLIQTQNG
ncbi:MAG: DNA repair protein RecN [Bryobacterales bacterium]|nr:DNA repair protein RecN [Bryobacterales bacterium]